MEEVVTRVVEPDDLDIARARFPVGKHIRGRVSRLLKPGAVGLFIVTSVQMELIVLKWVPLSSRAVGPMPTFQSGNCRWDWRVRRTRPIPRLQPEW